MMRRIIVALVVIATIAVAGFAAQTATAAIEITSFETEVLDANGNPDRRAGGRPYESITRLRFGDADSNFYPDEQLRSVRVSLPRGVVGDPTAVPQCDATIATDYTIGGCPNASQVGYTILYFGIGSGVAPIWAPIYNMVPAKGVPAQLAFNILIPNVVMSAELRATDYGVDVELKGIPSTIPLLGSDTVLWGAPADQIHDTDRGPCLALPDPDPTPCPAGIPVKPFLSNPTKCTSGDLTTTVALDSWENPGARLPDGRPDLSDDDWSRASAEAPGPQGCDGLDFSPKLSVEPVSSVASTPTGYRIDLSIPQDGNSKGVASAHLKRAKVVFPEGVRINTSSADGLSSCSIEQVGLEDNAPASCPGASKIGSVEIDTPLLEEKIEGGLYLARPYDNPFGSLVAVYLVAQNPERGVRLKLAGKVETDPKTGQVSATFDDNPELPFSKLTVRLNGGSRAPLINPDSCGSFTTQGELTPYAALGEYPANEFDAGLVKEIGSSFQVTDRPGERSCGQDRDFRPRFEAGTVSPAAGASSPFVMSISRDSDAKELEAIRSITLPEGLLGNVGSIELCGGDQANLGQCPEASRIGHVQTSVGAGSLPLWLPQAGKSPTSVSLTGPYRGAPYGLSIVVPAQAGPFDLGSVVVRSGLHVNERTTQLQTGVDEARVYGRNGSLDRVIEGAMPTILQGLPLNLRDIRVIVDREGFMVNPTDCSKMSITAEGVSVDGDVAKLGSRFTAANCAALGFMPRFSAKILDRGRRSTLRSFHPRTRFTVVPRSGDANIDGARVVLPSSTLLDQANIGTTCTRAQMAERNCPEASIVGYAKAWSPLLRRAVEGPVYLAANGGVRPLPDLAAVMDGEIRVVLQGEVSTLRTGGKARLQNTFRVVPDAPVSRFELTMRGGAKRGLLVNSADLCRSSERGVAVFQGQNGRTHRVRPRIATTFKGCGKVRRQAARRKAARKMAKKLARSAAIR